MLPAYLYALSPPPLVHSLSLSLTHTHTHTHRCPAQARGVISPEKKNEIKEGKGFRQPNTPPSSARAVKALTSCRKAVKIYDTGSEPAHVLLMKSFTLEAGRDASFQGWTAGEECMLMRPLGQRERGEVCSDEETRRKSGRNRENERVDPKRIQQHLLHTDNLILNSSYVIVQQQSPRRNSKNLPLVFPHPARKTSLNRPQVCLVKDLLTHTYKGISKNVCVYESERTIILQWG